MTFVDFKRGLFGFYCLVLLTGFIWLVPGSCPAQTDSLDDLQQQWNELEVEFAQKQAVLDAGEGDAKALRDQYRDLLDQANDLIGRIKSVSIQRITDDPTDKTAVRTLMGVLLNDAQNGKDAEVLSIGDTLIENKIDPRYFEVAAKADRLSIDAKEIFEELLIRQREFQSDDLPRVKLTTTKGEIVVELFENQAPNTVANFISLAESDHYNDMIFHRVLEDFMAQTGGYKSDGSGGEGPGYAIACECETPDARPHFSHCLSMAHAGKDTGGDQFFLTFARTDFLDGRHTCFGRVISGSELLDDIERTHISINGTEQPIPNVEKDRIIKAEVIRKRDHEYKPQKLGEETKPEPKSAAPPRDPNLSAPDASADDSKPEMSSPESGEKASETTESPKTDDDDSASDASGEESSSNESADAAGDETDEDGNN